MAHIDPVPGFASHPAWSSLHDNAIAALTPLDKGGAAWFAGRAWFLMTDPTTDTVRAVALDPASKKVALSDPLPAGTGDVDAGRDGSPWWAVTAPTPALLLRVDSDLLHLALSGDAVTITKMPPNPVRDNDSSGQQWIGDAIIAVSQNMTFAATGDPADAANKLTSSYYLDVGKKTWVAMTPQHDGTVIGLSTHTGSIQPVELAKSKNGGVAELWVGTRRMSSGFNQPEGATNGGEYPITSLAWSHDGTLLLGVGGIDSATRLVAYGPDGKARTGADSSKGTWNTTNSQYVLLPNQMGYNLSNGQTRLGSYSDNGSMLWEIDNATIGPDGTLYAIADPNPGDKTLPTGGSYVSEDGALDPAKHASKAAPALVMPDGAGLFLEGSAQLLARS